MTLETEVIKFLQGNKLYEPEQFQERYDYAFNRFKQENPVRTGLSLPYAIAEVYRLMRCYDCDKV